MAEAAPVEISPPEKKRATRERGIDDYKRKIWKLKKELEEQRELALTVQKDELEKLRQAMSIENEQALEGLKLETRKDLLQMRNSFAEKEAELSRTIKRQEEENKICKRQIAEHSEEVKGVQSAIESAHHETVTKLQREIKQLKHINQDLQQKYQTKQQDYRDKVSELKAVQEEAESERQKLMKDALTIKLNKLKRDQDSSVAAGSSSRDRDLQHKVTELTVALKRLEKRSEALKEENVNLKKTEASYRDLEEQCAKLRRRNADLANNVKSAGEKNKQLQVSSKKSAESADSAQGLDHAKKLFVRQRAKDFAEHAKALLNKDKEVNKLTQRLLALSDSSSNHSRQQLINTQLDMSTALRQGTKERMVLEMKSNNGPSGDGSESQATLFNMQVDYDMLQDKYDTLLAEKKKLEHELEEFRSRLGEIEQELGNVKKKNSTLQDTCDAKDKKCLQLTAANNNITKERDHLTDTVDKLTEEISHLKHEKKNSQRIIERLTEKKNELTKSLETRDNNQMQHLESNIESLTDQLHSSKSQLRETTTIANQLREENSVASDRITELLDRNQDLKYQLTELNNSTLPTLQDQTEELRITVKQLELKNEALTEEKEELIKLCNDQEDANSLHEKAKLTNLTLSEELSETKEQLEKEQKLLCKFKQEHQMKVEDLINDLKHAKEERAELEENRAEAQRRIEVLRTNCKEILETKDNEIETWKRENSELGKRISDKDALVADLKTKLEETEEQISLLQKDLSRELSTHNTELESFMQLQDKLETTSSQLKKVEVCNQELAVKVDNLEAENVDKTAEVDQLKQVSGSLKQNLLELELTHQESLHSLQEKSQLLEEFESDLKNKSAAVQDLESSLSDYKHTKEELVSETESLKQIVVQRENEKNVLSSQISKLAHDLENIQSSHLKFSDLASSRQSEYEEAAQVKLNELELKLSELQTSLEKNKQSLAEAKKQESLAKRKLVTLKQELTKSYDAQLNELNSTLERSETVNKELQSELSVVKAELEEQSVRQISVYAGDNVYHLYVACLAYDPSLLGNDSGDSPLSSPNKSADRSGTDSALSATERMQDIAVNPGDYVFVSGELTEEGYYEGHLLDGRVGLIPSNVLEPLYEFDIYGFVVASEPAEDREESGREVSDFSSTMFSDSSILPSTPRPLAPYPRNIVLDRQLANGILVGWDAPEGQEMVFVYQVYVDGKFRASLNGRSKYKALIEGVKSTQPHRLCITATTCLGESDQRHCTLMIGEPNRPPSDLTAVAINSESAHITFLPHNSNHHHYIYVNEEKVRNLAPSLFQVDVTGLLPDTEYTISVTACESLDQSLTSKNKKPLSTSIQFTMPSAEELADLTGGQIEGSFLEKFDQFLGIVTNGSPTPPVRTDNQMEPGMEEADFLRSYDATIANNTHKSAAMATANSQTPSYMISHSTPKYVNNKVVSSNGELEENFSPIVLDLDGPESSKYGNFVSVSHEKSNSESTVTQGTNELTPVNHSSRPADLLTTNTASLSGGDKSADNSVKSPSKSRSSPLQNKHSLQKMIKSLANKDKARTNKSQTQDTNNKDSENDSTPCGSHRHRNRSGDKKAKPSKKSSPPDVLIDKSASVQTQIEDPRLHSRTPKRTFRAVYDYEPASMSPNKDAVNEELGFKAKELMTVYGDVDADGFYLGQINGKYGYVPSNLVEAFKFDVNLAEGDKCMFALYDYDPSKLSPNPDSDQELSFLAGDIIVVSGAMDKYGFYQGFIFNNRHKQRLVPSNYLKEVVIYP